MKKRKSVVSRKLMILPRRTSSTRPMPLLRKTQRSARKQPIMKLDANREKKLLLRRLRKELLTKRELINSVKILPML